MKLPNVTDNQRKLVGVPLPMFLYTDEQVASMLNVKLDYLLKKVLWLEGREFGTQPKDRLRAVNIAPRDEKPVWRVEEREFIRWAIAVGFRTYERGWTIK